MEVENDPPLVIHDVHFVGGEHCKAYTITIEHGRVRCIAPSPAPGGPPVQVPGSTNINGNHGIIMPSMCHPHIHLDKPYLIQNGPSMACGRFSEALQLTNFSKQDYTEQDLLKRGRRLILESVQAGVTSMRAHVEVDKLVYRKCLDVGLALKKEFGPQGRGICDIQIAVFAQEPVFAGDDNGQSMRKLFFHACATEGVDVVGTTPYVEATTKLSKQNIDWVVDVAMLHRKHLDLHLDYTLDAKYEPLVYHLIKTLKTRNWMSLMPPALRVTLGHCTRLSLFPPFQLKHLQAKISSRKLPIHFIGLPMSDLYMMGRGATEDPAMGGGAVPRGTIPVLDWIRNHGFDVALGVNNVGNAFTPIGGVDPLAMIAGIGMVYQGGSQNDCRLLLECITTRAKDSIGALQEGDRNGTSDDGLMISVGDKADIVIVGARNRDMGVHELLADPGYERIVIKNGNVISKRVVEMWTA